VAVKVHGALSGSWRLGVWRYEPSNATGLPRRSMRVRNYLQSTARGVGATLRGSMLTEHDARLNKANPRPTGAVCYRKPRRR
jgi:hypothetical protein